MVAIKVPVYTLVYLTNLVMKVINEGKGFVLRTGGEFGGEGRASVMVFADSQGKIWSVTVTKWWIMSCVTGDLKKIFIASDSDMVDIGARGKGI